MSIFVLYDEILNCLFIIYSVLRCASGKLKLSQIINDSFDSSHEAQLLNISQSDMSSLLDASLKTSEVCFAFIFTLLNIVFIVLKTKLLLMYGECQLLARYYVPRAFMTFFTLILIYIYILHLFPSVLPIW